LRLRRAGRAARGPLNADVRPQPERLQVLMQVKVKPRSRTSELVRESDGTWLARLKAPPVDGRANRELLTLVAAHFKRPKAAVSIKSGTTGRLKIVKVDDP
jgi:uncharacterized protein (TIGR00251 family)